ncbi:MAG: hypothetical protein JWO91_522 [Acidobacteriaceae bacterium]|nr:hypothetical protein [Acidobacteriaceae bacterium]
MFKGCDCWLFRCVYPRYRVERSEESEKKGFAAASCNRKPKKLIQLPHA